VPTRRGPSGVLDGNRVHLVCTDQNGRVRTRLPGRPDGLLAIERAGREDRHAVHYRLRHDYLFYLV
jgi:hypothetical protein